MPFAKSVYPAPRAIKGSAALRGQLLALERRAESLHGGCIDPLSTFCELDQ